VISNSFLLIFFNFLKGKSNEIVNGWSAWCNNQQTGSGAVAHAVNSSQGYKLIKYLL
jgi:hypothetical protein